MLGTPLRPARTTLQQAPAAAAAGAAAAAATEVQLEMQEVSVPPRGREIGLAPGELETTL